MENQLKVLSTKKINQEQKSLLSNFEVDEEKLIEIELKEIKTFEKEIYCSVFTSKNAVKSVFEKNNTNQNIFKKVFCVGEKTATLLRGYGVDVAGVCSSAYELAVFLVEEEKELEKAQKEHIKVTFFCGNIRRDELPDLLREHEIEVEEIEVYKTELLQKKFYKEYDGILFFSPSAIKSYLNAGNSVDPIAFCIGNTTAVTAIMDFEKVYVAEKPSVESVIEIVKEIL